MSRCSIIIPVFNKIALTRQCLDAVFKTSGASYEVIVVDDASTDETAPVLKEYGGRIAVRTHSSNKGFAAACNEGALAASGDYLVFLNNDTIPKDGWLDALAGYADENPQAAAVGAKLLFPDETIQHAGMAIRHDRHPIHIYAGFPTDHPAVNKSRCYQMLTGACLLVRRDVFQEMKGFDTAFFNSHEDVDLCLRMGKAGHELHYCHTGEVYHLQTCTRRKNSPEEDRNAKLYLSRWSHVSPDDFNYYVEDGLIKATYGLQYPIRINISPELACMASWTEPHVADHMLHGRARQVHELLVGKMHSEQRIKELESRNPGIHETNGAATFPVDKDELVEGLMAKLEIMRGQLMQAHKELLLRDELQLGTDQIVAVGKIQKLAGFLNQLDVAVERLYQSRRWMLSQPFTALRRILSCSQSRLPGYGRIDDVLKAYKTWREKNPGLSPDRDE